MQRIYCFSVLLLIFSCGYLNHDIEFSGSVPNITNGVVLIKDIEGKTVFGVPIQSGRFQIRKQLLQSLGYYTFEVANNDKTNERPLLFDIYLEPGSYVIDVKSDKYPIVKSQSKIQGDLSAYSAVADSVDFANRNVHHEEDSLQALLNSNASGRLSRPAFLALVEKLKAVQNKRIADISDADKIIAFNKKYPQNQVAAHLLDTKDYHYNPAAYYRAYQQLSNEQKNSDEGREVGQALVHLIKLIPGGDAPAIVGNQPNGKPLDIKSLHKKVIIIDFWRSGDGTGRGNHAEIPVNLLSQVHPKNQVGVISVSFDTKRDWWKDAIRDDKMDWPQVSDLKGDDSPNAVNWGITSLPTYYVISGDGKIIEGNVSFERLAFVVNNYLENHH
jgi:hypothetical protein